VLAEQSDGLSAEGGSILNMGIDDITNKTAVKNMFNIEWLNSLTQATLN